MSEGRPEVSYWPSLKAGLLFSMPFVILFAISTVSYTFLKVNILTAWIYGIMAALFMGVASVIWILKIIYEIQGKDFLILTFREKPGESWTEYPLIESVKPITSEKDKSGNLIPYEFTFKDFPRMDKMILWSPCPIERLYITNPQPVFYKGFVITGSAAALDVVRLRKSDIGKDRVAVVIPKACDYFCEQSQKMAGVFDVTREDINELLEAYDSFLSVELAEKSVTKDAQIASLTKSLSDFDKRVWEIADMLDSISTETELTPSRFKGLTKSKSLKIIALTVLAMVGVVAVLIWLKILRV